MNHIYGDETRPRVQHHLLFIANAFLSNVRTYASKLAKIRLMTAAGATFGFIADLPSAGVVGDVNKIRLRQ